MKKKETYPFVKLTQNEDNVFCVCLERAELIQMEKQP